jgi:DNA-binding MarR family transcriptional regulator
MTQTNRAANYSPTPLHYLMFILQQKSDELLQGEIGISLSHVRILGVLDREVPCSQKSIAKKLQQTEDVTLTAKGQRRFEGAEKALKAQLNSIYRGLNKADKRILDDTIQKIINSL